MMTPEPSLQTQEPAAAPEDYKAWVVGSGQIPTIELVPGSTTRLVVGSEVMVSFLRMAAHSYFAPHRHKEEQIMIVLDGYCDEIIDGKRYRVKKGDVVVLPPNVEHGAYIYDEDVIVIDVFSGRRGDYLMKLQQSILEATK